jgi:transposase
MHITTLGIDVATHVFQLHGVDARGRAVLSRRVKRNQLLQAVASLPPCVIGMEAGGSAQHWGRTFEPLGHTVTLMHPSMSSRTSRPTRMMDAMRKRSAKR